MALFIIDGVPGSGKTLNTIKEVRDRSLSEARPVYYNYITDLSPALGWHELTDDEVRNWHNDLPEGAILVIDEAWRLFPKWESKKQPPDFVLAFFQHRKKGHDVYLIVQSARVQLDPVVYENTEAHVHFQRVAGCQMVKRFEWNGTIVNPKAASSLQVARIKYQRLDPSIYDLYKSAEIHTHKFRPPFKFIAAGVVVVLAIGAIFYNGYRAKVGISSHKNTDLVSSTLAANNASVGQTLTSAPTSSQSAPATSLELKNYVPRVQHLAWTAPVYDALRQPKSYPRPAACILNLKTNICTCYTQQATPLDVPDAFCRQMLRKGQFDDQIPDIRTGSLPPNQPPSVSM
jgi:zona occludens toxin